MLKPTASSHLISRHFTKATGAQQTLTDSLLSLLKQCNSTKSLRKIHAKMIINSIQKPNFLLHRLIDIKDFGYASSFFSHIPYPNEYAFNIMIRGLATTWKKFNLTIEYYYQMKDFGIRPNNFTYPFVFIACTNLLLLNHGLCAHSGVLKSGLVGDGHVRHSLITMYSRCGELGRARRVFDEISEKDLVSWNSMISGYSRMGYAEDAVGLFGKMRLAGFHPNEMTLVSLLGACGDLGDLGLGSWVEGFAAEYEMELYTIAMYGK